MTMAGTTHEGGCHCGAVRFSVEVPPMPEAEDCNCSICRMSGFLHLIVPAARFRLLSGEERLVDYLWNSGVARHRFCGVCGIQSFYVPRSNPDGIDVNVRCLDAGTVASLSVSVFDDGDRDAATAALAHLTDA